MSSTVKGLKAILSSSWFLKVLVAVVIAQGLWYAFSFHPTILDEATHIGFIEMYTARLSPFIDAQDTMWDFLGDITRNPSYLYYYLMSFPLRLVQFLTDSYFIQVLFLRLIHIGIFTGAIVMFDKALQRLGFSIAITRLALLLLILTPAISVLPGVVTYDTSNFLFAAILIYVAVGIVNAKRLHIDQILVFLLICIFGVLFKYTFLAVAVPVTLYLLWSLLSSGKIRRLQTPSINKKLIALAFLTVLGLGLIIERPVQNIITHGWVVASCTEIMGEDRCLANYTQQRDVRAQQLKPPDFQPESPYEFALTEWVPNMVRTQVRLNPWDAPERSLLLLYAFGFIGGIFILIYDLHHLIRKELFVLSLILVASIGIILLVRNYISYVDLGQVVATTSRYLLPLQPVFMTLVLYSFSRNFRTTLFVLPATALIVVAMLQGGGILSYQRQADPGTRWSDVDYERPTPR